MVPRNAQYCCAKQKGLRPTSSVEDVVAQVHAKLTSKQIDPIQGQSFRVIEHVSNRIPVATNFICEDRLSSVLVLDLGLDVLEEVLRGEMTRIMIHSGYLLHATVVARGIPMSSLLYYTPCGEAYLGAPSSLRASLFSTSIKALNV